MTVDPPHPPRLRFPRAARLTRPGEFRRVKEQGRNWPGRYFVLGVLANTGEEGSRIGFVTSRRIGGAVARNRVRRRLREIVRQCRPRLKSGLWIVLIARQYAANANLSAMQAEWLRLARRAAILVPATASRASAGDEDHGATAS